ncbi:hypothetical protein AH4AK4_1615 [Aeromonas hydrophila 4AK4]|nr:hypothetical protein AH4AK4_1615 [Aeromonas hydrophila 4AK4]
MVPFYCFVEDGPLSDAGRGMAGSACCYANDMFHFLPRYRRCECIAMASFVALVAGRKYAF